MGGADASGIDEDLNDKKYIYADAGIIEYWVVNLKTSQVKVFRDLENMQYKTELTLTKGNIFPLAFPNVSIQVQRLIKM